MEFYIKTQEWKQILAILRTRKDVKTRNESKLRRFIEAIWYMARSGCQWRLLPRIYGSWRAIHMRFKAVVAFFLYFRFKSVAKYMYKLLQSDKTHFTF